MFLSVSNASALRELQGTRDTTPVLCRVLLLAAAARGIGTDAASCGKTDHRVSHCPKARGRRLALWLGDPRGAGGCRPHCTARGVDAPGESPSRGGITCDSPDETLARWGSMRVVTTGSRRVVTTRLAQWIDVDD